MTTTPTARTSTPPGARTRPRTGVIALVLVISVWAAAVTITLLFARGNLVAAEQHVAAGREALTELDVSRASREFSRAEDRAAAGHRKLRWRHVRPIAAVPVVGNSVVIATSIAAEAAEVSAAAGDVTGAILALPGGTEALKPRDGTLPVDAMTEIAPVLRRAEQALSDAIGSITAAPRRALVAPVADARDRFLELAEPAHHQAGIAAELAEQLPRFLGADRPRRYFLGTSNPAELRGSGGKIGAFAVMTLENGQLDIGDWSQIQSLPGVPAEDVEAPNPDYRARYDRFGGAGDWTTINMTPDFPSAATAMGRLWYEVSGEELDGVVLVDPFAFQALLEVAGPVDVHGTIIGADNVVDYVSNEAYTQFESHIERKDVIARVATAALEGFLGSPDLDDLRAALGPLSAAVRGGHLLVHAADPELQSAFTRSGLDGGLPDPAGDHLGVFVNNAATGKQDFYVDRTIEYTVRLLPGGRASGRLDITFTNHTPSEGLTPIIIGPGEGLEAGQMHGLVSVFCAHRCEYDDVPTDDEGAARISTELGLPAADSFITVDSGGSERLRYERTSAGAWETRAGAIVYRLSYNDQTTIRPTALRVRLEVPDGLVPHELPPGAAITDGAVVWERRDVRGNDELEIRLVRSDG